MRDSVRYGSGTAAERGPASAAPRARRDRTILRRIVNSPRDARFLHASDTLRAPGSAADPLAALAIESGCERITGDRDFSRFPGLRWQHPLTDG